jgi:polyisoprenoid-binding protein YceI
MEIGVMTCMTLLRSFMLGICLQLIGALAWADWELDSTASVINFATIKNDSVGEINTIKSLEGSISVSGAAQITIHLASVETLIEIRNERIRSLLFETATFPVAQVEAQVDPALMAGANEGEVHQLDLPVTLTLHGVQRDLTAPVSVLVENDGGLLVFTTHPVLVNAADFGLDSGIEALRNVAGLKSISNVIPVTLQFRFIRPR